MKQYCEVGPLADWWPGERAEAIALGALSPVQRLLMVTDGTVTELLAAYFLEPIAVRKLGPLVMRDLGERVYEREVLLTGRISGQAYVHAQSTILIDRLTADLREGLLATDKGIGELLREELTETYRELSGYWHEAAGGRAAYFGTDPEAPLLGRSYVVRCNQIPTMRITERFWAAAFA
ncbi:chorismate--pyruvate lyase family protein [Gloeobacter violaceus]|uniref:Glr0944 protein n=1 Tax=Gloeobacter violaceus (strain ATCC 29082 / PCC 7421) TaxID=251221 RepID=Q7NM25_GLOVI|nr:chorismate pyruvate-lyase family protein [Gloeobacter violaceus]BAC88885.1 glr0944 [Gloeobacter violaceus PCC 7421]